MVEPRAVLGAAGVTCAPVGHSKRFQLTWQNGPALVQERSPARREQRLPHQVHRIRTRFIRNACGRDAQEIAIDYARQEIFGCEAIVGIRTSAFPQRMNWRPISAVSLPL